MIKRFKILLLPAVSGMHLFRNEPAVRGSSGGLAGLLVPIVGLCPTCQAVIVRALVRVACLSALWKLLWVTGEGGRPASCCLPEFAQNMRQLPSSDV